MKKKSGVKKLLIIVLAVVLCVLTAFGVWFFGGGYRVENRAEALAEYKSVTVSETDFGFMFDGKGDECALIFYPGAKVEDLAYADLLKRIAEGGVDCFLVHMPFDLAFLGSGKADDVMRAYDYERVYLAGHSLGGAMAAGYAVDNAEMLDGLIFLAAYSAYDLSESKIDVLSIYGSEDKVLNMNKVSDGRRLVPESYSEYVIDGGNHAGFGNYGRQRGDGEAKISGDEQRRLTAEKILDFISPTRSEDQGLR